MPKLICLQPREGALAHQRRTAARIAYRRGAVRAPPAVHERGHMIFVDAARALDLILIDHLIFTTDAVDSMRAGGLH